MILYQPKCLGYLITSLDLTWIEISVVFRTVNACFINTMSCPKYITPQNEIAKATSTNILRFNKRQKLLTCHQKYYM